MLAAHADYVVYGLLLSPLAGSRDTLTGQNNR